jgi:hypothetical protein
MITLNLEQLLPYLVGAGLVSYILFQLWFIFSTKKGIKTTTFNILLNILVTVASTAHYVMLPYRDITHPVLIGYGLTMTVISLITAETLT